MQRPPTIGESASTGKTLVVAGAGLALLGGLFAAFGGKPRPAAPQPLQGPSKPRKPCNCGR